MSATAEIPAESAAIERALQEIWRGEAAQGEGSALVCARTVNLVVWCACAGEADAVNRDVDAVTALHPGRVIVIDGSRGAGLQARVSASCLTSHVGDRYLGRETIVLCGEQAPAQQLTSLVSSLLLPDLPVFLWWRDVPRADSRLLAALIPRASRVVVDSASGDLGSSLKAVLEQVHNHRDVAFTDLAWTRVTPWRQLAAQFFDNPAFAGYVPSLRTMTIDYVPRQPGAAYLRPEPVFLSAWLALSLGHSPQPDRAAASGNELWLRFSGGKVPLEITLRQVSGPEEWIQEVVLQAPEAATFRMARTPDGHGFSTTSAVAGQPPVHRNARASERATPDCLARELSIQQRDELYERVLETACRISPAAAP